MQNFDVRLNGNWSALPVIISQAGNVPVDSHCFGWMAINKGDSLVTVDNIELEPGDPSVTPKISGESTAVIHPLGLPYSKRVLVVNFGAGTVNKVQIIQLINY